MTRDKQQTPTNNAYLMHCISISDYVPKLSKYTTVIILYSRQLLSNKQSHTNNMIQTYSLAYLLCCIAEVLAINCCTNTKKFDTYMLLIYFFVTIMTTSI